MRQSVFTITCLTLSIAAWGCASSGTTPAATTTTTVGLKSLDGDTVLAARTPEVPEGRLVIRHETVPSSGLWMKASPKRTADEQWHQPTPRLDRMYKLMIPMKPGVTTQGLAHGSRRSARQ